jgi:hypothetical protein
VTNTGEGALQAVVSVSAATVPEPRLKAAEIDGITLDGESPIDRRSRTSGSWWC